MESKEKLLEYYSTGRFQCDYKFHKSLSQWVKELNLHQWQSKLQEQTRLIAQLQELTQASSKNSVADDIEDEELLEQTKKIKVIINSIDSNLVHSIIKECQQLQWESYCQKIADKMTDNTDYNRILERIQTNIHSQTLKIDYLIFTALFEHVNGPAVNQFIQIYSKLVDIFLSYLNSSIPQLESIYQATDDSNICELPKIRLYICSLYFILKDCLRFCQILKILASKSNLSLKFSAFRKVLERITKKFPEWKLNDEKQDFSAIISAFKSHLKGTLPFNKSKVCRWCFNILQNGEGQHPFCRSLIENRSQFLPKND